MSTTATVPTLTGTYQIDPAHSQLGFAARHAMVATVRGQFRVFDGKLSLDADQPERSSAQVTVDAASLTTQNDDRDAHLRSADFFDVEQYPTITFQSTRAERADDETYRMWGDLTIRGVTREVQLDLTFAGTSVDPWGGFRVGFEGAATVSRKDWGLTWNVALEAGGFLVSDKVKLQFDISAVKQA